jgi:hypothetical protein
MKLDESQCITLNFDPKTYKNIPHPQSNIFEPHQFKSPASHQEAEAAARETIRFELSRKLGKPVYGQHELLGKGTKAQAIFDAIAKGEAVVR